MHQIQPVTADDGLVVYLLHLLLSEDINVAFLEVNIQAKFGPELLAAVGASDAIFEFLLVDELDRNDLLWKIGSNLFLIVGIPRRSLGLDLVRFFEDCRVAYVYALLGTLRRVRLEVALLDTGELVFDRRLVDGFQSPANDLGLHDAARFVAALTFIIGQVLDDFLWHSLLQRSQIDLAHDRVIPRRLIIVLVGPDAEGGIILILFLLGVVDHSLAHFEHILGYSSR